MAKVHIRRQNVRKFQGAKYSPSEKGFALVEMMIAIVVISFFMIGTLDAMALCSRSTSAVQNQMIAASIAQELIDVARNQSYATLMQNAGRVTLSGQYINHSSGNLGSGLSYLNRPLVLDPASNTYSSYTWNPAQGSGNIFNGSVQQTITDLGNNSLALSVRVSWPAENGGAPKQLVQSTVINANGISYQ